MEGCELHAPEGWRSARARRHGTPRMLRGIAVHSFIRPPRRCARDEGAALLHVRRRTAHDRPRDWQLTSPRAVDAGTHVLSARSVPPAPVEQQPSRALVCRAMDRSMTASTLGCGTVTSSCACVE